MNWTNVKKITDKTENEFWFIKTVAENWVRKQSWFVLKLKLVHSWLKSHFCRNKTFVFQDRKLKFSASFGKNITQNFYSIRQLRNGNKIFLNELKF